MSTAILIFTKTDHGGTDQVRFYGMTADGFSLNDKQTEKSFLVPKQEIVDNGYDLSINKYKEIEYVPVEYPPTEEIMAELRELERQIGQEELQDLKYLDWTDKKISPGTPGCF